MSPCLYDFEYSNRTDASAFDKIKAEECEISVSKEYWLRLISTDSQFKSADIHVMRNSKNDIFFHKTKVGEHVDYKPISCKNGDIIA